MREMKNRDQRRLFSDQEKTEIISAAGYRCQGENCKAPDLTTGQLYEFHHNVRHADGGLTSVFNGSVLCVECHRSLKGKGSEHGSVGVDAVWDQLREWQCAAIERFKKTDDGHVFVLEAAPGAGKTLFAALAARFQIDTHPEIGHVICIAPWRPILESMKSAFGRMKLQLRSGFHYDRKAGILQRPPMGDVTIDTYAGFCNQDTVNVIKEWKDRYSFRFMLILDEVHHTNIFDGKWGPYATEIASLASKVLVMSGTFFRSDNKAISFLEYRHGMPVVDYSISYSDCVRKRYVRQVAFKYHNPQIEFYRRNNDDFKTIKLGSLNKSYDKLLQKAKLEVLDPRGHHVNAMIVDAWQQLQGMRRKWDNAACLVVCQPGSKPGHETKMIHGIARKIQELTQQSPIVVTSCDAASHGAISEFAKDASKTPFLCAVRMVSEGVDIPRIRMVLFLSYTDSEMLFRQIVGRAIRYTKHEDDTAALVIMPQFPVMTEFADRFEKEAKAGAVKLVPLPPANEDYGGPGESKPCRVCNLAPCECYVVIGSEAATGGGTIAGVDVRAEFVDLAQIVIDSSSAHQHANVVQLGDAFQKFTAIKQQPLHVNLETQKNMVLQNITNVIEKLAHRKYGGSFSEAYRAEIHEAFNVASIAEIKSTWRLQQIEEMEQTLRNRLREELTNERR